MLQSALKNGYIIPFFDVDDSDDSLLRSAVKRIVITSSTATVREAVPEDRTFSEVDWNNDALKKVEEQGRDASFMTKYQASKVLAEKGSIYPLTI
jgi:nucleoside-diphosphate-sugar epimerase